MKISRARVFPASPCFTIKSFFSCHFPDVQRLACGVVGHVLNPFEILAFIIVPHVEIGPLTLLGSLQVVAPGRNPLQDPSLGKGRDESQ